MNRIYKYHKFIGIVMFLPFLIWGFTALVFYIKPGYNKAYEQLKIKTYPIEKEIVIGKNIGAGEVKILRTILGYHLLLKNDESTSHLNALTLTNYTEPSFDSLKLLIDDALSIDPERYGKVIKYESGYFLTNTGIRINFDWNTLSIYQYGKDTEIIDTIYKLHYLQFTGIKSIDEIIGAVGIFLILLLAILGLLMAFKSKNNSSV